MGSILFSIKGFVQQHQQNQNNNNHNNNHHKSNHNNNHHDNIIPENPPRVKLVLQKMCKAKILMLVPRKNLKMILELEEMKMPKKKEVKTLQAMRKQ